MTTTQIERREWPSFFDGFTRQHQGWIVTLEVFQPEMGAKLEEQDLVLVGVTAELSSTDKDKIEIEIMIGDKPDRHITHTVLDPVEVNLEHTEEGANHALAIKGADDAMTLLCLRSTAKTSTAEAA